MFYIFHSDDQRYNRLPCYFGAVWSKIYTKYSLNKNQMLRYKSFSYFA